MHDDLLRAETGLPDVSYVCASRVGIVPHCIQKLRANLLLSTRPIQSSTSVRPSPSLSLASRPASDPPASLLAGH